MLKSLPVEEAEASEAAAAGPRAVPRGWSPYIINGGTVLAVSGEDFCVIAGDSRCSYGYSIVSRDVPKVHRLTSKCVIATAGMQAEAATLRKVLDARLAVYEQTHKKPMSTPAIAQLLSSTLYSKRFFPYYTFNVVGGVDKEGKGAVYGYDAIGSFERVPYSVSGSGSALITSLFDNQVEFLTQPADKKRKLSLEETIALVKDAFTVCCERDIYTGDTVDVIVITADEYKTERFELARH